jgi:hypothetical protein
VHALLGLILVDISSVNQMQIGLSGDLVIGQHFVVDILKTDQETVTGVFGHLAVFYKRHQSAVFMHGLHLHMFGFLVFLNLFNVHLEGVDLLFELWEVVDFS